MAREDQRRINVVIGGIDYGLFDKKSETKVKGNIKEYKAAGGKVDLLGGRPDPPEDVTLSRKYDKDRDHPRIGTLRAGCGSLRVVITDTLLDAADNPQGRPDVLDGMLEEVNSPGYDSQSNDAQILEIVVKIRNAI